MTVSLSRTLKTRTLSIRMSPLRKKPMKTKMDSIPMTFCPIKTQMPRRMRTKPNPRLSTRMSLK